MRSRAIFFIILSVFCFTGTYAQGNSHDAIAPYSKVEIPNSRLERITSSIVGQEYDLYVDLPGNYQDTSKTFPVLYLLDAQWDFPLVTSIYGQQYYDGFIPAAIIVGITWGGRNPNHDSLRARDLTPTNNKQLPQSGNAIKFLAFIKNELIPFIESRYRTTKDDRTLMGSSFGGLFTLYALFHESKLFNRYVLTSPALGWDNEAIYTDEKKYADNESQFPVKLFMAVGELEEVSGFQKFVDRLKSRGYKGLDLQTRVLEGMGHSGGKAEGYTRGLQAVFARPSLILADNILDQYVGVYQFDPRFEIKISKEDGHLCAKTPDNNKIVVHAETESDFYVKGQFLFVHFRKDEAGKVNGFQLQRFGGEGFVKKIE
jgi:hypothetical protein